MSRGKHTRQVLATGVDDPYAAVLGMPAWRARVPRWLARFLFEPPDVIRTRRS